jgi:predicted TIM-barrel fold metal-dependent hydrolase
MMDAYAHLDMSALDPLSDLEGRMDAAGVSHALAVETWGKDNHACLDSLIASESSRFRVALCFRPEEKDHLDSKLFQSNVFRALRIRTADIRALGIYAEMLEASGKCLLTHAEAGIGELTKELLELTQRHPDLKVFVPHLGWPIHEANVDPDWYDSISRLSMLPNVIVGISAIAHFSRDEFPHKDVEPFATHLLEIFGAELLVAGSDYPLFEKSRYAEYMQLAEEWIGLQSGRPRRGESALWGNPAGMNS